MSNELIPSVKESLHNYFDEKIEGENEEQLREALTQAIVRLLLNDMEKLLTILYRIDVSERKVKEVFAQHDPKLIAPQLSELILKREAEKVKTRNTYQNPGL
jgi:hypothetical protein